MDILRPIQLVQKRSYERSAEFIEAHVEKALLFGRKPQLHTHAASLISIDGLCIECGVFRGKSINRMAALLPNRHFHGFDSFEGLFEGGLFHFLGCDRQQSFSKTGQNTR